MQLKEREYFKERFTEEELRQLLGGRPAGEIFSWRSPTARKLGYKPGTMSDDELIRLMVAEPNLIKRPLVTVGGELVAGFDKPARARLAQLLGRELS